jgi:hypothetical protein
MFGPPDPVEPIRDTRPSTDRSKFERAGFVSLWAGTFDSVEDAELYFGCPEEVEVFLPPEAFAADFALGDFPSENLEVNFEQVEPRPLRELLLDATYAVSYLDAALEEAARQGIEQAQGVALLFDFDYRLNPDRRDAAGPLRFVGTFPFVRSTIRTSRRIFAAADEMGCPAEAVLIVFEAFLSARTKRQEDGASGNMTARELCEHLLRCRGDGTPAILRELGLRRSEDVGRVVAGLFKSGLLVKKGPAGRQESDPEADYAGLFVLDAPPAS